VAFSKPAIKGDSIYLEKQLPALFERQSCYTLQVRTRLKIGLAGFSFLSGL
jgi:hypothetical protein